MRLSKEEYREANRCLKQYNYNCIRILNIRADIMNISAVNIDGMPHAKYTSSNNVLDSVIKLQEDKELQKIINEYRAVIQALSLVNKDSKYIFEEMYVKGEKKWKVIDDLHISEETFKRRKRDLIYTTHIELKKILKFIDKRY